jgi:tetratricopeptide (TPR) repeat protein
MAFGGEDAESYYDEGLTASMKGEIARAVECLKKALEMDPSMVVAEQQLAKCYGRLGHQQHAVAMLKKVVAHRPKQLAARSDLGYALLGMNLHDEAQQQFRAILDIAPNNARAHLGLGHTCFHQGNWAGAVQEAQFALNEGGPNFAVLYLLGRAARLTEDFLLGKSSLEQADKLLEKLQESSPNQPESPYLRGEVAFTMEQYASALEHYRKAEEYAENGKLYSAYGENFSPADILAKQGLCLQRLGKDDRARELGERVLKLDPNHRVGQALIKQ